MANAILTKNARKMLLYRGYTLSPSATQYLPPTQFKVGISQSAPGDTDTDLSVPVPILYGTVLDDGSNTYTGDVGADNSTDNTTTYKEGAGTTDATAQNLIGNNTNATKRWTLTLSTTPYGDEAQYVGAWLYIKDATALAKFKSTGTALSLRIGSNTSNYFALTKERSALAVGWNWITSYNTLLGGLPETGTVAGNIDTISWVIFTNNATDTFVAGDVVIDLVRQYEDTDLAKDYVSGYPVVDLTLLEITTRSWLTTLNANGFELNGYGDYNEDASPLLLGEIQTSGESKSDTDEIIYVIKDRLE